MDNTQMKEIAESLRATLVQVLPLLQQISDADASFKPLPHKWSKKEILGHLIDSACNNQQKFVRTMLAQTHLDFVGYRQNEWVALQHYNAASWESLISFWYAYNLHIAHVIEHVNPALLENTVTIDGTEPFRLGFIMPDYVEHLKHHLRVILPEAGLESTFANVYNA
jgi:DinB superfamily